MKHFDAYSVEDGRNGKGDTYDISLRDLVDYYFVPLKACIDIADVAAFMCSYNAINHTAAWCATIAHIAHIAHIAYVFCQPCHTSL
jgi:beta-glucosidase-like glycosyl hydrolase